MWGQALVGIAAAAEVHDLAPETEARPVLLVVSPGFGIPGFLPLAQALRADGHDVQLLTFGCGAGDLASFASDVAETAAQIGPDVVVVAHGIGATVVLAASPSFEARRLVLLAPIAEVWPVEATTWLADRPIGASVDLSAPLAWKGRAIASVLLGDAVPPLTCAPAGFAAEVAGWVRGGGVPLALIEVDDPVWIGVSSKDNLAAVEVVVPVSRLIPDRDVARLGINRLDSQDFGHGEMLLHPVPVRAAVRAAR